MTTKDSILCKRIAGTTLLLLLTGGIVLHSVLATGSNYRPILQNGMSLMQTVPDDSLTMVREPADSKKALTIGFVGNCIIGSMLGSSAYGTFNALLAEAGPSYFLEKAYPVLASDDWTVCALGSVLSDANYAPVEKSAGELSWYLAPTSGAAVLSSGSIDIVSLATDHTGDYGADGYSDTQAALEAAGLLWGDDEHAVYLEQDGIRIGLYLCTLVDEENDLPRILDWIEGVDCDFIVIYPHGHMGGTPEEETVLAAYRTMVDAGADLVLATHSGMVSTPFSYGNGVIMPSLGSFLSGDTRFPEMDTGVFRLKLLTADGKLDDWSWEWIPFYPYNEPWQPVMQTE